MSPDQRDRVREHLRAPNPELVLHPGHLAALQDAERRARHALGIGDQAALRAAHDDYTTTLAAAETASAPHPIVTFLHDQADHIARAAAIVIGWHGPHVSPVAHEDARFADAIRAIVARHDPNGCDDCDPPDYYGEGTGVPCDTLRALAAVWQTRPGYNPDWTLA